MQNVCFINQMNNYRQKSGEKNKEQRNLYKIMTTRQIKSKWMFKTTRNVKNKGTKSH